MHLGSAPRSLGVGAVLRVTRRSNSYPCAKNRVTPGHRSVPQFALQRCGGSWIERVRGEKRPHVKPCLPGVVGIRRSHRASAPCEATAFDTLATVRAAQMPAAEAILAYLAHGRPIPSPREPRAGEEAVILGPGTAARVALATAMLTKKISNVALAKMLGKASGPFGVSRTGPALR
jgi:hypothetical protein